MVCDCFISVSLSLFIFIHVSTPGTSVWYHIYQGSKIFYLIPPTPSNLKAYAEWSVSAKQGCTFFPNVRGVRAISFIKRLKRLAQVLESPDQCSVFKFYAGDTLMIPSGWIHAVYTPEDSLVFGGNFLHSFSATMQLDIYRIERETGVSKKYTFPMYEQMISYMLTQFVASVTNQKQRAQCIKDLGSLTSILRASSTKKSKRRRRRKKMSPTAWQIFVKERMASLNSGVNATTLMKQISIEWKQMTSRRKSYYVEKSDKLKNEFEQKTSASVPAEKEEEEEEKEDENHIEIPEFDEKELFSCLDIVEKLSENARQSTMKELIKSRTTLWRARRDFNLIYDAMRKRKIHAIEAGDEAASRFIDVSKRLSETYDVICDESYVGSVSFDFCKCHSYYIFKQHRYAEIEREHVSEMTWTVDSAALVSKEAISAIKNAVEWLLKHESVYPLVSRKSIQSFRAAVADLK